MSVVSVETVDTVEPVVSIETVGPVVSVVSVVSIETVGPVVHVGPVEPVVSVKPVEPSTKVKIPRTNGSITLGNFGGLYARKPTYVVLKWVENGIDTEKMVQIIKFVELNPEYAYLLPQPQQIIFEFSQAQIEAFQQCEDCPPCLKGINCDK
jgi:hypothetical protein